MLEIQALDSKTGFEFCVFPKESRRKRAGWLLYVGTDGSAAVYLRDESTGAPLQNPFVLPATVNRAYNSIRAEELQNEVPIAR